MITVPLVGGGPNLSPVASRPLVQSHLQTQGHEFSGSGYQDNPIRQVEKGRPGKALAVITAAAPDRSLCAQTGLMSHWLPPVQLVPPTGPGRRGLSKLQHHPSTPGRPRWWPTSCNLRDMLPPVTESPDDNSQNTPFEGTF